MKSRNSWFVAGIAGAAVVVVAGLIARAGDLNPPPGPVSPTMVTLDDLNNAIAGIGGGGCDPACVPALSGIPNNIAIVDIQDLGIVFNAYNVSFGASYPVNGCIIGGGRVNDPFTLVKDLGCPSTVRLLQAFDMSQTLPEVRVDLFDSTGANYLTYRLLSVKIVSIQHDTMERCDGTFTNVEAISILWTQLELECPGSNYAMQCIGVPAAR